MSPIKEGTCPMSNRRQVLVNAGLVLGAATTSASAVARATKSPAPARMAYTVPTGPWTEFGDLPRAGGMLHYAALGPKDGGGKPPIVLLHKLGGWLSDWRFVAPALAQGRRVLAFDLPGHGGSRWEGAPPYIQTLGETAALLVGALDELGIDQIDLIGTSLGGCVGVPLSAFWPERVRKLAIVSSALGGRHTLAELKVAVEDKQRGVTVDAQGYPVPVADDMLRNTFGMVNAAVINKEGWESRKAAGLWAQPSERGVGITDIRGTLKRVTAPTLLLYGEYDKAYFKFREAAEAALPHPTTKIVMKSGAFVMMDNPTETARILRDWVQS
jgi:pimeloyl-ACP methyl ester carboxylesterase